MMYNVATYSEDSLYMIAMCLPIHKTCLFCSYLYKCYAKLLQPAQQRIEQEPEGDFPLPPKPIVPYYFVGWTIALIPVGITAAVNLEYYIGPY